MSKLQVISQILIKSVTRGDNISLTFSDQLAKCQTILLLILYEAYRMFDQIKQGLIQGGGWGG